jgi:hypothetical protein
LYKYRCQEPESEMLYILFIHCAREIHQWHLYSDISFQRQYNVITYHTRPNTSNLIKMNLKVNFKDIGGWCILS